MGHTETLTQVASIIDILSLLDVKLSGIQALHKVGHRDAVKYVRGVRDFRVHQVEVTSSWLSLIKHASRSDPGAGRTYRTAEMDVELLSCAE